MDKTFVPIRTDVVLQNELKLKEVEQQQTDFGEKVDLDYSLQQFTVPVCFLVTGDRE